MVYTKTGDNGTTSLVGGLRVKKSDPRVEAYGTADELNSVVGLLAELLKEKTTERDLDEGSRGEFDAKYRQLKKIQNRLFVVQTLLATERGDIYEKLPQLDAAAVADTERWIDAMEEALPRHNSFVIPGGSIAAAQAHVARTVCRRTERAMVRLDEETKIEETLLRYINRLSDYLFVLSRYILLLEKKEENFWRAE